MSTGLFDDLLLDDAPASTGLFDDLLAPDERRRRRGGVRNEFEPYVAGVEPLPDHLAPIEASTAQAGRGSDAFARRDPRRVDRFVPDATFGSVAQDIGAGLLQIGPTAVKGVADIARLATGDTIGKGLSDAMEGGMDAIRKTFGSERAAAQRRNFEADMRDDSVSAWEALSENKGALADQILPTLGSMALPMGAAGAVGKLATMGRAAQALDKTALAARVASAQQAAGIGATAAQNAADTFAELVDRGVPMDDAYVAAGITVPFSVVAGRLTGGGAEMAAMRALSGGGVGRGLLALGQATGREGFQEIGEEFGQITGEAVATGAMPSLASAGKQLAVAGVLGGIVGGGVNVAGQAAETWRGAERAQDPLPRVEPALDTSIDQTVPPAPRRDPVETALDPSAPLDGKSLLDAFGITRVEPRAADPAPQSTPSTPDPLTEDYAGLAGAIEQAEAARGIAQPPAAPAMAHPQEEAPGALPTEPAPQYEILGSGTMLVKRPISEVRPLAPGAWMISAPGGTIVSRSAAPTVQAALDAEAQSLATSAAPAVAAAPDEAPALAEGQPALTPAQAARALQAAPSRQPQPAAPQAQTTAASEVADYTANRDGTLIVNLAQQEAAALLPDVKLIQTGRGLLVGRTSAQEVAALLDVMHVPQSFASQQEASDFGRKHWPDGDIEVSNTGSGWVIMPRPKLETAHALTAVAASVARLNAIIQREQRGADRGGSVDVVPDADLVGVAGQQAAVLGRAIRAAFGVPIHFVRNLTANGAWYDGRVLLDVGHLSRNAQSPERTAGMLVAVTGHETEHAFQTSKDPRDVAINARLANVVRKHLKAGALQEQLEHEQSKSRRQITRKYAFREIGANLGGGFWAQSSFWGDVYALDKGSTARRLFYRFMQAATKMATVLRGSRFDPSRYVSDVAAVKAAYVQATAERLGMRLPASPPAALPASLPATPPVAQSTSAAPGAAAQDRSTPGSEPDPRLQDPELRDEFEASRADIGWQQIGGRLLRDPRTAIDPNAADAVYNGDVVGRTQWLGSDLWRNRPHKGGRVTEQEAGNAIDRALRGAPLSARQRRFVSYVLDSIEARMTARERAARDALDEALIEAQDARIEAGIDAFWASLAEVEAQEERDAIQAQDGADTEDAGRAGQAASAVAGVSQEGDNRAQDAPRQGGVADETGLTLEAQTPADLQARAQHEHAAAAADKAEQRRLADKAKADAERDEFVLTGSDRAADVGAAAGQQILFSQSEPEAPDAWIYRFWSSRAWSSEDEARGMIRRRIEEDNERYAGMFKPSDPGLTDGLQFVKAPKGQVKLKQPKARPQPFARIGKPADSEGPDRPGVDWTSTDLNDDGTADSVLQAYGRGKGNVYRAWVDPSLIPSPKGDGIVNGYPDMDGGYDWRELQNRGSPPPLKLRIGANGKLVLMDGNHRLAWWRERGYSEVPAYVIDERKGSDAVQFSQSDIDFTDPKSAADVLMAWGAQAQYQYDKTEAKDLAEIAEAKGAAAEPETVTQPDNTEKPTGRWEITLPDVKPTADLVVEGDKVFINVARLPVGSGGSRVYDIAAQFALNNGKVFIGDPSGVSPAAMRRRLENMLSSAIKYGTTDHLAPHPRQTIGDSSMDLPPLKWQTGDTRGNILAMLRVSNAVNDRKQASGSGVDYDAGAGAFRDSEGVPLERVDEALSDLSEFDRGTAGPGAAGRTTLQRAALFSALLRSDSARRSLLARLRGVSGDGGKATGRAAPELDRILYSQSDDAIDLATLYDGIIVEQPILIEDTGQTGTLRLDAGKAIADIDERSRKMRRLLACLG